MLLILKNASMVGTFYFGFWVFIYEIAWWNKPMWLALMSGAVPMVLSVVCFCAWAIFEMWMRYPDTMPILKIERGIPEDIREPYQAAIKEPLKEGYRQEEEKLPI